MQKKNSLKTKKKKLRIKKRKQISYKKPYYGGDILNKVNNNDVKKIMDQVKLEGKFNLGNIELVQKAESLLKGLFLQATENLAKLANIDIKDSKSVDEKLSQIKEALVNPENKEKLKIIISEFAIDASIALKALSPFLQEFSKDIVPILTKTASDVGESIVKVGLNTAGAVPGIGIMIGIIRNMGNIGDAITSGTNAATEILKTSSDAIKGTLMNYRKLSEENMGRINNINTSINDFQKSSQIPTNSLLNISQNMIRGGGKYKKLSKEVLPAIQFAEAIIRTKLPITVTSDTLHNYH